MRLLHYLRYLLPLYLGGLGYILFLVVQDIYQAIGGRPFTTAVIVVFTVSGYLILLVPLLGWWLWRRDDVARQ